MNVNGFAIWLTGLSGAGKSTISDALTRRLRSRGRAVQVLDGDVIRTHLSNGLGFSREDRDLNVARIAFVASVAVRNGGIAIVSAISPYAEAREAARRSIGSFVEIYVRCSLDELIRRDVKGLYAKALRGEIAHFTGVSDPYEPPGAPEIVVDTESETVEESVEKILSYLESCAIDAHGGTLANRLADRETEHELRAQASGMQRIVVDRCSIHDIDLIGIGAYSPLDGFMGPADYENVLESMRLSNGLVWPLPITLAVPSEEAPNERARVALCDDSGNVRAILEVRERFKYSKSSEARHIYGTEDATHPGVAAIYAKGDVLLGGVLTVLPRDREPYELTPAQARAEFLRRGWKTVVGFQTSNPIHPAQEYVQRCALEIVDGLFVHPLIQAVDAGDVPLEARLDSYNAMLKSRYPLERFMFAALPGTLRYAGGREAIFQALIRKNYGCTHVIVGRDHTSVGYGGSYDPYMLIESFAPSDLGIVPLMFDTIFFCRGCDGMSSVKNCPHREEDRVILSEAGSEEGLVQLWNWSASREPARLDSTVTIAS
ncbi:MAG: adenylyl-sulfate kinase [Vulcanimicrobiaceae bacterium]